MNRYSITDYDGKPRSNNIINYNKNKMIEYYEEAPPEQYDENNQYVGGEGDISGPKTPDRTIFGELPGLKSNDKPQDSDNPSDKPPDEDNKPQYETEKKQLSAWAVIGIVIAVIVAFGIVLYLIMFIFNKVYPEKYDKFIEFFNKDRSKKEQSDRTTESSNISEQPTNTNQPGQELQGGLNDFDVNEFSNVDELYGLPI